MFRRSLVLGVFAMLSIGFSFAVDNNDIIISYYKDISNKDRKSACQLKSASQWCEKKLQSNYTDVGMAVPYNFSESKWLITFNVYYEDLNTKKNTVYTVKKKIKDSKIIDVSSNVKKPINIAWINTKYNIYYVWETSCEVLSSFADEQISYLNDYKKNPKWWLWLEDYTKNYVKFISNIDSYSQLLTMYTKMKSWYSSNVKWWKYRIVNPNKTLSSWLWTTLDEYFFAGSVEGFGQALTVCPNIDSKVITSNLFGIKRSTWTVDWIESSTPFKVFNKFIASFNQCYHGASIEDGCSYVDRSLVK
jgi:hypothetical protein